MKIGNRLIGPGHPALLIAEIGINHNADMDLAVKSIQAATKAGADMVKFQNYKTEDFVADRQLMYTYTSGGKKVTESQYDMFKRYELTDEQLVFLKEACDAAGVLFMSTPTSQSGINILVKIGSPAIKNGSDYLVNLPLIRAMARTGLPTILSTGMATLAEIDEAVRAFREAGGNDLILLHCVSSYPAPVDSLHLRKLQTLASAFGCISGFSDHAEGVIPAVASVVLGGSVIEKHFTLDKNLPGPDHHFSSDPKEFAELVQGVRTAEKSLGIGAITPSNAEVNNRASFRLSCVAAHDLAAGKILAEEDITFKRPASGLMPNMLPFLIGKRLKTSRKNDENITLEDIA